MKNPFAPTRDHAFSDAICSSLQDTRKMRGKSKEREPDQPSIPAVSNVPHLGRSRRVHLERKQAPETYSYSQF